MLDIQLIVEWLTRFGVIVGVILAAYKLIDKHLFKRFAKLEKRVADLESWTEKQQLDITESAERDRVIMGGVLACLKGFQEMGRNGPVTEAIREINAFISEKAYMTFSRQRPHKAPE